MSSLNFNDGVSIDTSGDLRTMRLKDGWYVVGNGMSVPCNDKDEAEETLKSMQSGPTTVSQKRAETKPERVAHITIDAGHSSSLSLDYVQRYLPSNYSAVEYVGPDGEETIQIRGRDNAGWTMDGYVIPRLASANVYAREVK